MKEYCCTRARKLVAAEVCYSSCWQMFACGPRPCTLGACRSAG
jgi:hypothetical protein